MAAALYLDSNDEKYSKFLSGKIMKTSLKPAEVIVMFFESLNLFKANKQVSCGLGILIMAKVKSKMAELFLLSGEV